jgi:hypothetical protein
MAYLFFRKGKCKETGEDQVQWIGTDAGKLFCSIVYLKIGSYIAIEKEG